MWRALSTCFLALASAVSAIAAEAPDNAWLVWHRGALTGRTSSWATSEESVRVSLAIPWTRARGSVLCQNRPAGG